MALGKLLTSISTFLVMLLGLAAIGGGVWLTTRSNGSECIKFLQIPLFVIGGVLFLVGLVGFLGAMLEVSILLLIYLAFTFIAMLALLGLTVFAFLITNQAVSTVSGKQIGSVQIPDFSNWLQYQVTNPTTWNVIRSCVHDSGVCSMNTTSFSIPNSGDIYSANLAPIKSGCCLAPTSCNTTSATPPPPSSETTSDCQLYGSSSDVLCYSCAQCKAGVLKTVRDDWRTIAYLCLTLVVILFVIYIVGCCGYRSARRNEFLGLPKAIV